MCAFDYSERTNRLLVPGRDRESLSKLALRVCWFDQNTDLRADTDRRDLYGIYPGST